MSEGIEIPCVHLPLFLPVDVKFGGKSLPIKGISCLDSNWSFELSISIKLHACCRPSVSFS